VGCRIADRQDQIKLQHLFAGQPADRLHFAVGNQFIHAPGLSRLSEQSRG
jgi:hypothetical protein